MHLIESTELPICKRYESTEKRCRLNVTTRGADHKQAHTSIAVVDSRVPNLETLVIYLHLNKALIKVS